MVETVVVLFSLCSLIEHDCKQSALHSGFMVIRCTLISGLSNPGPNPVQGQFASIFQVLRVIDRSDRNPPITATSVTLRPSLHHASGL